MSDLNKIGLRFSPLSERVLLARFGKDPDLALETRDAMNEFLQVLVQFVGEGNEVDFGAGDEQFTVSLSRKNHEHKENSSFVPVPNMGTFVPGDDVDFTDIIAALEETHGFAALSPAGRDNIEFAIDKLNEARETIWRIGFVDGEKEAGGSLQHIQEYAAGLEKTVSELQTKIAELRNYLYGHWQEAAHPFSTVRNV